jgi:uncharacterized SAM-binding protein YcdF (DUF218 family)
LPLLLVLLASTASAWLFIDAAFYLESPAKPPAKADVAVILGGDSGYRVLKGAEIFADGLVANVLVTGRETSPLESRPVYLRWRAQALVERGVPEAQIVIDPKPDNSWEEAVSTRRQMEARGWRSALVISDPFHMRRLDWIWARVFAGSGLRYSLVASSPEYWKPDGWWRDERTGGAVIMEYIKLAYYVAKY